MSSNEHRSPNRLIHEKSPYLLQHAYNPIDWYPWGEEAFAKAKREDKPIFLSCGYSTCHWCHVMERESFEDAEVAALLNERYVSIKVDREERPDVDHIYMNVCQRLTGQGGWPLTILMTPDKRPFFAGTYFPKNRKYGRPGIMDVLSQISDKWMEDKERVIRTADQITEAVQVHFEGDTGGQVKMETFHDAYETYKENFDPAYGGFGTAPKFPSPHNLGFLLRYYQTTGKQEALDMVKKTLDAMYEGGIYDHLGFGFARYSTDRQWLVPHFEKMLYDNALLAIAYLECYQITGKVLYKKAAHDIFTYVERDMTSEEGGFYSAEDADSEGEEGKFYVWTPDEIKKILGEVDGELFCEYFDVTPKGNFEGHSILNLIQRDPQKFAAGLGFTAEEWERRLEGMRDRLFEAREKRIHPHKDDKILTAWNGLMIAALSKGARILEDDRWRRLAEQAATFIENSLIRADGRLLARYREGEAAFPAYIDDYAFMIWGLIELYETTFEAKYLQRAISLQEDAMRLFWDERAGGFYFYGTDSEQMISRPKELYDGAMPSGNSVAAMNMVRLARLTGKAEIEDAFHPLLDTFAGEVNLQPTAYSHFLMAALFASVESKEVVIVGKRDSEKTKEMLKALHGQFLPHAVVLFKEEGDQKLEKLAPFIREQHMINGETTAYVCQNFSCHAPTTNVEKLKQLYMKGLTAPMI